MMQKLSREFLWAAATIFALFSGGAGSIQAQALSGDLEKVEAELRLPKLELIDAERLTGFEEDERNSWQSYLALSQQNAITERRLLAEELARAVISTSRPAPASSKEFELDSKAEAAWFRHAEASFLAEAVLSYQTPTGGWSKAIDYSKGSRGPGTHWTSQSGKGWHYCGTLDNRSTTEQIRFLAALQRFAPRKEYRESVLRGLRWLLVAQFPNGGWPQVYPLEPGYHEAVTLNDNAMLHAIQLLQEVGAGKVPFDWIDPPRRAEAAAAADKGIDCLLRAQVIIDGKATVWCAQHDPLTLKPVAARLKEPPSLSGAESAELLKFLMRDAPDRPEIREAISAALDWFTAHQIVGLTKTKDERGKTVYVADTASVEIYWARFYELQTQQPIFAGAQDGVIYSSFSEMAKNNKVAYDYFTTRPSELLSKEVARWKERLAQP